jgi:hypothetical protein
MKRFTIILLLFPALLFAKPVVKFMYPLPYDSVFKYSIVIPDTNVILRFFFDSVWYDLVVDSAWYVNIPFIAQPMHPDSEIGRFAIIDSSGSDIHYIPFEIRLHSPYSILYCDTGRVLDCPCPVVVAVDNGSTVRRQFGPSNIAYSLDSCVYDDPVFEDTMTEISRHYYIGNHASSNIHMEKVSPFRWEVWFGSHSIRIGGLQFPTAMGEGAWGICKFCNDSDECSDWILARKNAVCFGPLGRYDYLRTQYNTDWPEYSVFSYPPNFYVDVTCFGEFTHDFCGSRPYQLGYPERFYLAMDSTSAWFTISWDGGCDSFYYGDPGITWEIPPGKHIGWRRLALDSATVHLPEPYVGFVYICLQDVTNAPVIAFGEPTHLHPDTMSCYDTWVYYDPNVDSTYHIENWIPAPPVPVCKRYFFEITEIAEPKSESKGNLALEVVTLSGGSYEIFYSLPDEGLLEVLDIMGRVVIRQEISGNGSVKIDVEMLTSGVYFAVVKDGQSSTPKTIENVKVVRRVFLVK